MNQAFEPACTPIAPPWEAPQVIPAQLRRVNNLIFRKIGQIARTNGVEAVTPMHGWIMEYLYRHSETPVFQRDIEREFSITRSTVTNILQLMERKGYITRQSVAQDARLKQLVLTEKGRQFIKGGSKYDKEACFPSGRIQTRRYPDADVFRTGSSHGHPAAHHHGVHHRPWH